MTVALRTASGPTGSTTYAGEGQASRNRRLHARDQARYRARRNRARSITVYAPDGTVLGYVRHRDPRRGPVFHRPEEVTA